MSKNKVFLGGVCGETTWRSDQALPFLINNNIKYYNPQHGPGEWNESFIAIELKAKEECEYFLHYINKDYTSLVSMLETLELGHKGKQVYFVMEQYEGGDSIAKDVQRARKYLVDMVKAYENIFSFDTLGEAMIALNNAIKGNK